MSQIKSRRRRRQARRRIRNICIIAVVVVILFVLLAVLWKKSAGDKKETDKQEGALSEESVERIEFPYGLKDGKIEITSLFQYTGMNPDCSDESGEDIASLEITNKSGEYLTNAEFTAELEDGTKFKFTVKDVPAGRTAWAYAVDNSSYDLSVGCKSITCEAEFEDTSSLMEDALTIDVQETEVTLTNISGEELTNLNVYCHCLFEEAYFGGLTYIYPVESIPAGESVILQAEECYLGQAEVVRVSQGD